MSLDLLDQQTNDAKILYLTDNSTWDDGTLPVWTTITSATLEISYKTPEFPDGITVTNKDITDVFAAAILASDQSDLVFAITSLDLELGSDIELPDGIYSINYIVFDGIDTWEFGSNLELLLDVIIKFKVYKLVGSTPVKYVCASNYYTKPIDDNLLIQSLYDSMQANAFVAQKTGVLDTLEMLQRQTA